MLKFGVNHQDLIVEANGAFNSVVIFLITLVLTFGVNGHDMVVGENDAARVYLIPERRIHPIYISSNINDIK